MRHLSGTSRSSKLLMLAVVAAGLLLPVRGMKAQELGGPAPGGQAPVAAQPSSSEAGSPAAVRDDAEKAEKDENDAYMHSASVKAIGAKLGMTPEQAGTTFQVANFAILAALGRWYKNNGHARHTEIQKHLVDARTATEEASARLSSVEERLSKLDGQIAAMKAQAEKDSAADEQRIKASVEEEKKISRKDSNIKTYS